MTSGRCRRPCRFKIYELKLWFRDVSGAGTRSAVGVVAGACLGLDGLGSEGLRSLGFKGAYSDLCPSLWLSVHLGGMRPQPKDLQASPACSSHSEVLKVRVLLSLIGSTVAGLCLNCDWRLVGKPGNYRTVSGRVMFETRCAADATFKPRSLQPFPQTRKPESP